MNIKCPTCNSEQITSQKKGFGFGKALAGIFVAGPLGIIAGAVGSNKIEVHCLNCGNKWLPSQPNNKSHNTISIFRPNKKEKNPPILSKEKIEEKRRREIYKKTGLSACDPNLGNSRSKKR